MTAGSEEQKVEEQKVVVRDRRRIDPVTGAARQPGSAAPTVESAPDAEAAAVPKRRATRTKAAGAGSASDSTSGADDGAAPASETAAPKRRTRKKADPA